MTTPLLTSEQRFKYAFDALLSHEGGYSNQVLDDGGPTKFGITQRELTRVISRLDLPSDVANLSLKNAETYYKIEWWNKYNFQAINSLAIATKVFDMAVNMGEYQATKLIQSACNWIGFDLEQDGIMGPKTLAVLNEIAYHKEEKEFFDQVICDQIHFYRHLVDRNPKLTIFLKDWLNRASYRPA